MKKKNYILIIYVILLNFIFTIKVNATTVYVDSTTSNSTLYGWLVNENYDKVILNSDINLTCFSSMYVVNPIDGKDKTIDLNGHRLSLGPNTSCGLELNGLTRDGTINIIDSSKEKTGILANQMVVRNCRNSDCHDLTININGGTYTAPTFIRFANDQSSNELYLAKDIALNISNITFTGNIFLKHYAQTISFKNSLLSPESTMNFTNYEYEVQLSEVISNGYKVVGRDGVIPLNTNINDIVLNSSNLYVAKDIDIVDMQNFITKNINYEKEILPLKLKNSTNDDIEIESIAIDNPEQFELNGDGNILLKSNKNTNTEYTISPKEGLGVGKYTTNIILSDSNGNTYIDTIKFEVESIKVNKPVVSSVTTFDYDENEHEIILAGFDNTKMELSGNKATEVGTYTATVSLLNGYCWEDGSTSDIDFAWEILSTDIRVNKIIINASHNILRSNEIFTATVYPTNAANKSVTWSSSDTNIATINPTTGLFVIKTKSTGRVTITATANDDSNVVGTIDLYVGYIPLPINEEYSMGNSSPTIQESIYWKITDETVLQRLSSNKTGYSIGGNGNWYYTLKVRAIKAGESIVSMLTSENGASLGNNSGPYKWNIMVYTPLSIELKKEEYEIENGTSEKIIITKNSDVTDIFDKVYFASKDYDIASVDSEGNIFAHSPGTTEIKLYSSNGSLLKTIGVSVVIYSTSLEINSSNVNLNEENNQFQIEYTVMPSNVSNKFVTFESSNESIVTVSNTGLVTAVGNGTATITVRTEDGRQTKNISVIVSGMRKDINSLNYDSIGNIVYDGSVQTPEIVIKDGNYKLVKNTDYRVTFNKNTNVGTAEVNIEGIGNYKGNKTMNFNITKANINVTDNSKDVTVKYDGKQHSIDMNLDYGQGATLKYMDSNNEYTLNEIPKYTEVGTYVTKYKVYIDSNYIEYYGQKTLTIEEEITYVVNNYEVDETNKYISKIMVNTELNTYTSNITLGYGYGIDVDSKVVSGKSVLYTGGETRITKGQSLYAKYTNVVVGDINGDGAINSADLLKIRQHLLRTNVLSGAYFLSSDINYDNTINSADLLRVRQHLLGTKPIE